MQLETYAETAVPMPKSSCARLSSDATLQIGDVLIHPCVRDGAIVVVLQYRVFERSGAPFVYLAFMQVSDPVTLTDTSEKNTRIGFPSLLPR